MTEQPNPGDKVRASFEGQMDDKGAPQFWAGDDTGWVGITKDATVEVIERADDPSRDPIGTVREGGNANNAWAKTTTDCWTLVGEVNTSVRDSGLLGTAHPIIGAVPGTPAWDAWCTGELPGIGGRGFPAHTDTRELWSGDGSEEPPADVKRLKWSDFRSGVNSTPYLRRANRGGWYWEGDDEDESRDYGITLAALSGQFMGTYTEVRGD